jgi:hypothetical protein
MHLRALFAGLAVAVAFCLVPQARAQSSEPRDCSRVDWQAEGYRDASTRGSPSDATSWVEQHRQSCMDVVGVDEPAYETGFIQGLTAFCTPRRAFDIARAGGTYVGWCPADQANAFAIGLRDGRRVRTAETAVTEARQETREQRWRERQRRDEIRQTQIDRSREIMTNTSMADTTPLSELLFNSGDRTRSDQLRGQREQRQMAEVQAVSSAQEQEAAGEDLATLRAELGDRYGEW